tara:strand:+ start:2819 stop:3091 length:273 start_codon:yes stop_codon:yes gene_type:complete
MYTIYDLETNEAVEVESLEIAVQGLQMALLKLNGTIRRLKKENKKAQENKETVHIFIIDGVKTLCSYAHAYESAKDGCTVTKEVVDNDTH